MHRHDKVILLLNFRPRLFRAAREVRYYDVAENAIGVQTPEDGFRIRRINTVNIFIK